MNLKPSKHKYIIIFFVFVFVFCSGAAVYAVEMNEVLSLVNNYYYDNSDLFISTMNSIKTNDKETFINAIEKNLDKYSDYYTTEEVRSEMSQLTGNPIEYSVIDNEVFKIKINAFEEGVDRDFLEIINKHLCDGTETLFLDLSDCTGGRIDIMANIAKEITPSGLICTLNLKNSKIEYFSELGIKPFNIVVITSPKTASAAEALTAALMESNSAIVIGKKTYGKSAVQQYFALSDGGILKLTVGRFTTRHGEDIEGYGIKPHIIIPGLNN